MDRKALAIKGSVIGIVAQLCTLICNFFIRTATIRLMGKEVLGLDSVLLSYISMLSLAELGISSSMIFRLYKPIIEHDSKTIGSLMHIYKKIYQAIAIAILLFGILLSFFLPVVINDLTFEWEYIYIAYYIHLLGTVSTYLLSYKRVLLTAQQEKHICMLADTTVQILFCALKLLSILLAKNYLLYLVLSVCQNILSNLVITMYCNKKYSYTRSQDLNESELKHELFGDTKNIIWTKIAGYIYGSTDNMIISIICGTPLVGILSNYKYIYTALNNLLSSSMGTIQPLIGNYLNSTTKKQERFQVLNQYGFIRYIFAMLTGIPFFCLCDIFIKIWAGSDYLLTFSVIVFIVLDYYISIVYGAVGEFAIGMGLFKEDKKVAILGAVTNLFASIAGGIFFGIEGVLSATVLSQIIMWIGRSEIVFRNIFPEKIYRFQYWRMQLKYLIVFVIMCAVCRIEIIGLIHFKNICLQFILGGIICVAEIIMVGWVLFHHINEYKILKELSSKIINQRRNKNGKTN